MFQITGSSYNLNIGIIRSFTNHLFINRLGKSCNNNKLNLLMFSTAISNNFILPGLSFISMRLDFLVITKSLSNFSLDFAFPCGKATWTELSPIYRTRNRKGKSGCQYTSRLKAGDVTCFPSILSITL